MLTVQNIWWNFNRLYMELRKVRQLPCFSLHALGLHPPELLVDLLVLNKEANSLCSSQHQCKLSASWLVFPAQMLIRYTILSPLKKLNLLLMYYLILQEKYDKAEKLLSFSFSEWERALVTSNDLHPVWIEVLGDPFLRRLLLRLLLDFIYFICYKTWFI